MNETERLIIMDQAREYANDQVAKMEPRFQATFIRDALYCAYLRGAGIRT